MTVAEPLHIYVPGPARGKGRHRIGQGRAYTPRATAETEKEIAWEARRAMKGRAVLAGPLKLVCEALYEVPPSWSKRKMAELVAAGGWKTSKPDGDNIAKLLADALNPKRDKSTKKLLPPIVWQDDSQVVDWRIIKRYTLAGLAEGLYITISELGGK